ncbi:oligoribonuclease [Candidatus Woesearchaeota archaeon]|nr:oligoribonuclease [Candidatus Woesearchaeota archaeon]
MANLVWVDLEMTGLEPEDCVILEIAVIITDLELNIIAEGPDLIIHVNDDQLNNMDEWCTKTFAESGLTEESRKSKLSLEEAEKQVLEFVKIHCKEKECYLAGNSIHHDKRFLIRYMSKLVDFLHYRMVDVSTIKVLRECWHPNVNPPPKKLKHRALEDIKESIEELKFYRTNIFK